MNRQDVQKNYRYPHLVWLTLIVFSVLVVFWPITSHGPLPYDDPGYVTGNLWLRQDISWPMLIDSLSMVVVGNWHPVTLWSHLLDYKVFGANFGAHHAVSLCIHAINSILCYMLFLEFRFSRFQAGCLAVVFAIHPLHVESVAWLSARKDVLSGFFWFCSVLTYIHLVRLRQRANSLHNICGGYLVLFMLVAMAMMAKPTTLTLPFVFLLLDMWPLDRFVSYNRGVVFWRQGGWLILEKIPFFALSAGCVFATIKTQGGADIIVNLPLEERIGISLQAYIAYLKLFVAPASLSYLHELILPTDGIKSIVSLFFLISVSAGLWFGRARFALIYPSSWVGWLFFLGTLVPMIGLVKVGSHSHAERYMYLSLIGLLFVMAPILPKEFPRQTKKRFFLGLFAGWLLILGVIARDYASDWGSFHRLAIRALVVQPGHCGATMARAEYLITLGEYQRAGSEIESLKETCSSQNIPFLEGKLLVTLGRFQDALVVYNEGLLAYPGSYSISLDRAKALLWLGDYEKAMDSFRRVQTRGSYSEFPHRLGLGQAMLKSEKYRSDAVRYFEEWSSTLPEDPVLCLYKSIAYEINGMVEPLSGVSQKCKELIIKNQGTQEVRSYLEDADRLWPGSNLISDIKAIRLIESGK